MKKLVTFALAATMTIASSVIAFGAEPIAVIPNTYTFEKALQDDSVVDKWENPFQNKGYDVMTVQYTTQIPSNPSYLTGYDTVMTFGMKSNILYICNELVGINDGGPFIDFWPSGETGTLVYPGKGESYTVNLVFSKDGVAFYLNGQKQAGSNTPAQNAEGSTGTLTGQDMVDFINKTDTIYIGDNKNISFWAEQDQVLSNIVFFEGEVTTPYELTGSETSAVHIDANGEKETEEQTTKEPATGVDTSKDTLVIKEGKTTNSTMIIVIVIVVIVIVFGVAAVVILSQKRR